MVEKTIKPKLGERSALRCTGVGFGFPGPLAPVEPALDHALWMSGRWILGGEPQLVCVLERT